MKYKEKEAMQKLKIWTMIGCEGVCIEHDGGDGGRIAIVLSARNGHRTRDLRERHHADTYQMPQFTYINADPRDLQEIQPMRGWRGQPLPNLPIYFFKDRFFDWGVNLQRSLVESIQVNLSTHRYLAMLPRSWLLWHIKQFEENKVDSKERNANEKRANTDLLF